MFNKQVLVVSVFITAMLSACQHTPVVNEQARYVQGNEKWQANSENVNKLKPAPQNILSLASWLNKLNIAPLNSLITAGVANNKNLKAKYYDVLSAQQSVIILNASDYPTLNLSVNQSRQKVINNDAKSINNAANIELQLSYELDLWGKLSNEQQRGALNYAREQAEYKHQAQVLIANIASAWFSFVESQQLLHLYQQQVNNLSRNLEQIQASYRLGISQALDVYLSQNELNRQLAQVKAQQQQVNVNKNTLALLIGSYSHDDLPIIDETLPFIDIPLFAGVPADLITRRFDLNASWFQLLSTDASLAIAHKQRFPRLVLSANTGDSSDEIHQLLESSSLAWSLLGNITTPLFNAGALAANEQQAKLLVHKQEQLYLQDVYAAFSEVENKLSDFSLLRQRYQYFIEAQKNAEAAEQLAFNQYLKGLITYTTVLEAQRRAFDAQTTVIQLQNLLLQNQIDLSLALGGDIPSEYVEIVGFNKRSDLNND